MPKTTIAAGAGAAALVLAVVVVALVATGPPTPPEPPEVVAPSELRALVGGQVQHRLLALDPDGDVRTDVAWSATGLPQGARLDPGGRLTWAPDAHQAGTWHIEVVATDSNGSAGTAEVTLLGRHRPRPHLYLALGDSVASGHGLDLSHWLGRDPCWRDAGVSYPALVNEVRSPAGWSPQLSLVACSGHDSADLLERPVGGGPDVGDDGAARSQVEWAVAANPGLVSVTIGANDLGFGSPERALTAAGDLDEAYLDDRLDRVGANLSSALDRLVGATDAHIVVTTYHNPTAERPQGVAGCREACFRALTEEVVERLNGRLAEVARRHPAERVVVADVASRFEGRGAPNGRGPDALRAVELPSWVPSALRWAAGVHAYCAKGHEGGSDTYVSAADCIHPNQAGARAYADEVLDALGRAGWG